MAVPKKRTSKAKKNSRKANWKRKAAKPVQKALSLARSFEKSYFKNRSTFVFKFRTKSFSSRSLPKSPKSFGNNI
jgi:large subunit ribosomal protein L32